MAVFDSEGVGDLGLRGDMRTETTGDLVRKAKGGMGLGVRTGVLNRCCGFGCRRRRRTDGVRG